MILVLPRRKLFLESCLLASVTSPVKSIFLIFRLLRSRRCDWLRDLCDCLRFSLVLIEVDDSPVASSVVLHRIEVDFERMGSSTS